MSAENCKSWSELVAPLADVCEKQLLSSVKVINQEGVREVFSKTEKLVHLWPEMEALWCREFGCSKLPALEEKSSIFTQQVCEHEGVVLKFISVQLPNGELWFKGVQIAKSLGYVNHNQALGKLPTSYKKSWSEVRKNLLRKRIPTKTQPYTIMINESGFYALIMHSNLPHALKFKNWLCEGVLPIRKNGKYVGSITDFKNSTPSSGLAVNPSGYVYIATTNEYAKRNVFKIGKTLHLAHRLSSHNCSRDKNDLLYYVYKSQRVPYYSKLEEILKRRLRRFHRRGEIYQLELHNLLKITSECSAYVKSTHRRLTLVAGTASISEVAE